MIKASDAKILSKRNLQNIEALIRESAAKGKNEIYYPDTLTFHQRECLLKCGYKIEDFMSVGVPILSITW